MFKNLQKNSFLRKLSTNDRNYKLFNINWRIEKREEKILMTLTVYCYTNFCGICVDISLTKKGNPLYDVRSEDKITPT